MEEEKQVNNGRHRAFDSKNYTIFDALVEAMQKKREEKSKKLRFPSNLRPSKSTSKKEKILQIVLIIIDTWGATPILTLFPKNA